MEQFQVLDTPHPYQPGFEMLVVWFAQALAAVVASAVRMGHFWFTAQLWWSGDANSSNQYPLGIRWEQWSVSTYWNSPSGPQHSNSTAVTVVGFRVAEEMCISSLFRLWCTWVRPLRCMWEPFALFPRWGSWYLSCTRVCNQHNSMQGYRRNMAVDLYNQWSHVDEQEIF